jgi:site-specific DNA-methyltransferase (adenine-specific)
MLDQLPSELWGDGNATFLDPVSKTGVFLREIAVRLNKGLESQIPDQQERINHIYKNQLFGLAITELTSLLSRRGVYCSKTANGKYSICTDFNDEQGNIRYERMEHTWQNGRCTYCGASESEYNREDALETYAYQFIHTNEPETFFNNMKFDVIIGNPPYQLSDGGAQASATPIYHLFIEQAKKLKPRYLTMIVPARWYSGGRGLDSFRAAMLDDNRLKAIHDFPETTDVFPGLNIRGGICYFLWDKEHTGLCEVTNYSGGKIDGDTVVRPLKNEGLEFFIRYNRATSILDKVLKIKSEKFIDIVSAQKPFGLRTFVQGEKNQKDGYVKLHQKGGVGYIKRSEITQNTQWIDKYKVLIARSSPGGDYYPHQVLSKAIVAGPGTACTETYIVIGPFKSKKEAENVASYVDTQFFRFLVILIKNTQDVPRRVYGLVPMQDFSKSWTDEELFSKYKITKEERVFIDKLVRPK